MLLYVYSEVYKVIYMYSVKHICETYFTVRDIHPEELVSVFIWRLSFPSSGLSISSDECVYMWQQTFSMSVALRLNKHRRHPCHCVDMLCTGSWEMN